MLLRTLVSSLFVGFYLLPQPACLGQAASLQQGEPKKFDGQEIRQSLLQQAQDYVVVSDKQKLTLKEKSLLNWANPARGSEQGVLMVWLDDGMPLVLASLFTYEWQGTKLKHELISLSEKPLTATYRSQPAWNPNRGGVKWREFVSTRRSKSLKKVASSKAGRLVQMRGIGREFKLEVKDNDRDETEHLRFMSEPVYRFASKKHKTKDGAVFSFCVGTDPEAFLVVRATENDVWQYAFVPSHHWELTANQGKKRVWHSPQENGHVNNIIGLEPFIRGPYVSFHLTNDRMFEPHPDLAKVTP